MHKKSFPILPRGPATQEYIDQLVNTLQQVIDDITGIRDIEGTTLRLTSLPMTGNGLPSGSVFNDDGILRIVESGSGYAPTLSMEFDMGSVTVTVS